MSEFGKEEESAAQSRLCDDMTELKYVITDPLGIHARPAGQLCKQAARFVSAIQVGSAARMVDAKRIMGVMGLALKQGEELIMTFDGQDEKVAAEQIGQFLRDNL